MSNPKTHEFWKTQPVPQTPVVNEAVCIGPIDAVKRIDEVAEEPLPLASSLEWWTPDLTKADDLNALFELLKENYVEDSDNMFRFNYSTDFLRWALTPPGYRREWHTAVRLKRDGSLLAFIAGIPKKMKMGREPTDDVKEEVPTRTICEINFLCIHRKLRDRRLAPLLIQEVTRRVNRCGIWQAIYTSGSLLPTPFTTGQYYHRGLNPEKLVAVQFYTISSQYNKFQNPMAAMKRAYQLAAEPQTRGLRPMVEADAGQVSQLMRDAASSCAVAAAFDEDDVRHFLLPRSEVVYTYVVEQNNGTITDFFSFASIPSTVIGNSQYSHISGAYVYYYAATSVPLDQLMGDLLIVARDAGFDVCNMVDIAQNKRFMQPLKFRLSDGQLHYYFYNWSFPSVQPEEVGIVML